MDGNVALPELPEDVMRFVIESIDTVPHLEALLIIWDGERDWSALELSARIYLSESATYALLQDLHRAGLAASDDSERFRFEASSEVRELMPRVAATYRSNISRVATLIHNKASSAVRAFARAFEFKKDR